ncbi:MAG: LuxR C-terminal-related transcriptional regulator, partial [Jiangellaceae bacterium]
LDNTALDAVTRALSLAEPEGLRRPFLVLGHKGRQLVLRHQELVGSHREFAAEILDGLTPNDDAPDAPLPLATPLTDRELTMLRYLPTMLTNSEIGADLHVSVNTVKAHLKSLYRKLEVADRRGAVRRARMLGLI